MSEIRNAAPRAILRGAKDESTRELVAEAELIPQHLPHIPLFTERGNENPTLAVGGSLAKKYGAKSFDYRSKFANHGTLLANTVNGKGNTALYQRLKPEGAATAVMRLALEVVDQVIPKYERGIDGQFVRDSAGNPVQAVDGTLTPLTVSGKVYIWHLNHPTVLATAFGEAVQFGDQYPRDSLTPSTSVIYPIVDLEVASFGSYGDRVGMRLSAPTSLSSSPSDVATAKSLKEFLYRFQFVERPENLATPNIIPSKDGDTFIDLVFGDDVAHPIFNTELSVDARLLQAYKDDAPAVGPVIDGPFGKMHFYRANVEAVQDILRVAEHTALVGLTDAWADVAFYNDAANNGLINLLSGMDIDGVPYEAIRRGTVDDTSAVSFDPAQLSVLYATGGADGDLSLGSYDLQVRNLMANYDGFADWPLLDDARYPQSCVYDTGFSLDTKRALMYPVSLRKDMYAVLGTYYAGEWIQVDPLPAPKSFVPRTTPLTASEESSMAVALRTIAESAPESEVYGTPVVRAIVVSHSGKMTSGPYRPLAGGVIQIADWFANYMGAPDWKNGNAFDNAPNNVITMLKDINATWKKDGVRNQDWANGLIWFQSYDTRSYFCPAFQTAYPNDTSVLNSALTMAAVTELEKVCQRVFRQLTGNTELTKEQFIERSDEAIRDMVKNRFDGRYIVRPETFYTKSDEARGYSWSTNIHLYANNMKTVGTFTVVAHRMEDLPA